MTSTMPWLNHYPPEIPHSLEYPDCLLQGFLEKAYRAKPAHVALRFLGKNITYHRLYQDSLSLGNALRHLGVKKGTRVAIMLPNCPQTVISYYACLFADGIVVFINPLAQEQELVHLLQDSGAELIIALDLAYPKIARIKVKTALKRIIMTGLQEYLPFPKNILYRFAQSKQRHKPLADIEKTHSFAQLLKRHQPTPLSSSCTAEDIALLQYTGGTTGLAKGVMLTHRNLVANAYQCRAWLCQTNYAQERSLAVLPFFHVYGLTVVLHLSILQAFTMIMLPKFNVSDILKTIEKEKPTIFAGSPTMYTALLNYPRVDKYALASLKVCISGSAPLPLEIQERFERITAGKLVEGYGLTEAAPVTHVNLIWGENKKGSIGIPWSDTEAMIISMFDGKQLSAGEIGELAVKGPQVMKGYWHHPEETEAVLRDGWLLTGDLAYMDEEGYFYLVDRKKDLIIAGGYNIYPREIEEVLYQHPLIKECAVVGLPDKYRGETVKAFIVLQEGATLSEQELDQFCRTKLAAYKLPKAYEFRESLPKSMIGKVLRRLLVEESL